MADVNEALRPCPFCGGEKTPYFVTGIEGRESYGVWIECIACLARGPRTEELPEAIATWNTLSSTPAPKGEVVSLSDLYDARIEAVSRYIAYAVDMFEDADEVAKGFVDQRWPLGADELPKAKGEAVDERLVYEARIEAVERFMVYEVDIFDYAARAKAFVDERWPLAHSIPATEKP